MNLKYGTDERPPKGATLLYALQWLLIAIPVVITSSFIAPEGQAVAYTQKMFGVMGATMLVQMLWGHRLPLIAGPAAALLTGILAATLHGYADETVYTSVMAGGVLIALLGAFGVTGRLMFLFTPRITVSILLLISFTIAKPIVGLIFSDPEHYLTAFAFAVVGVIAMAFANERLRGVWKTAVVSVAMIAGSLLWYAFTGFPEHIAADSVRSTVLLPRMEFDGGVLLAFLFCYIALFINEVGSVQSLGAMVGADRMERRNRAGMTVTGIMNIVAGSLGTIGPVDYSLSPGVVASTSCASRYPLILTAAVMTATAFCAPAVGFLMTIPSAVMGCVLLFLMATQLAAGFEVAHRTQSITEFRHGMIIGLPVMLDVILTFAPSEAMASIPSLIRPIAGNGFVAGVIFVLLLEHLLLRDRK
ncbi:MAG: purine/pyrimidine permease [Alistipes sp.]|nr:purine/pyrimidine permease [Alistipes sp.]